MAPQLFSCRISFVAAAVCTICSVGAPAVAKQVPSFDSVVGGAPAQFGKESPTTTASYNPQPTSSGQLRYTENSGICETVPGVYQASGYADIAFNKSMWFWFYEARNNASQAPLTLWLNGGPGASSLLGLLQENGPCRITQDGNSVTYNNYSWNNYSNILYIDQPIGVGFSYGTLEVFNTTQAAADIWSMLQIFFADSKFSQYKNNNFGLWTESYGGHYGPGFASYFLNQNTAISRGQLNATTINLKNLGVGNGLTDALYQYTSYLEYATHNPYRPTVDEKVVGTANKSYYEKGGCEDLIKQCQATNLALDCAEAQVDCNKYILAPLAGDFDVYDVREDENSTYPPDITPFLTNSTVINAIGANSTWQEENMSVYINFLKGGDWAQSYIPALQQIINAGIRTVLYDGDADFILNYIGVENLVDHLQTDFSAQYANQSFTNYTVAGQPAGLVKNAGSFSYIRVFGAGHEVPAYNYTNLEVGQAAAQIFQQAIAGGELKST